MKVVSDRSKEKMSAETWSAVDRYFADLLNLNDVALTAALEDSAAAGLPPINVSPTQGKLLHLLARSQRARRILEIGTLGGYSAIWLARALKGVEGARLITLEADEKHAAVARKNIARAKLGRIVEIRLGRALDTLAIIAAEKAGPFDLIFIDADKPSNCEYFKWAMKLSRPGTLIIVDNVVRKGQILDAKSKDAAVQGSRKFNRTLAAEKRVVATAIQTVGSKGYDGFAIALVMDDASRRSP
jgi:predicted O-methyltransferase YrrM